MARIRTIKPEFPQSESMGRVSREARLCFIMLWTIADDSGRLRGNQKMLASLLFPYDDDAPIMMSGWLNELEDEECIVQYKAEGQSYIEVINWNEHQKIDKPTPSKIPGPDGSLEQHRSEHDIEMVLFDWFKGSEEVFGHRIIDVQRQVRVGSSYLDIVVVTNGPRYVFELKKNRLTVSDLRQVDGYAKATGGAPILVGSGLSPLFPVDEAKRLDVAVFSISDDNSMSLIIPSNNVIDCSITLSSVSRSYSLDQGREGIKEGIKEGKPDSSPSQRIQEPEDPRGDDASTRLERARQLWNSLPLPEYRHNPLTMPIEQRGDALRTLGSYSDEEVAAAIRAYVEIKGSAKHKLFPTYVSFAGFMRGGLEAYGPGADPFERCKLPPKPGEYVDPDHDEKMRKAKERAKEFERPATDEEETKVDVAALIGGLTQKMTKGVTDGGSNKAGVVADRSQLAGLSQDHALAGDLQAPEALEERE